MRVLITGANGFLGRNLQLRLQELSNIQVVTFVRGQDADQFVKLLEGVDFVFHLAGVNRPLNQNDFFKINTELTKSLYDAVCLTAELTGRVIPILFASSRQALLNSAYGVSKKNAEDALRVGKSNSLVPVYVYRLPNVFGKWCLPNYNSVVATFCHNLSRNLPIHVNDSKSVISLVYVDDVINSFTNLMLGVIPSVDLDGFSIVEPEFKTTVGELANQLQAFKDNRFTLISERVGAGLCRALYATYVSYLPLDSFVYDIPSYLDSRGVFVEFLKTSDSGQFSYFTAYPGVTRGGHYHHSKTEKFLVIKGNALFRFRHMHTNQVHELQTSGTLPKIVETIPGWAHDITNIGVEEIVVILWANEIFDRANPDTISCKV